MSAVCKLTLPVRAEVVEGQNEGEGQQYGSL
jgi:hypothetical protein